MEKVIQGLEMLFKKNNYEVLAFHDLIKKKNKFCFDFLVKKSNLFYLIKVFPNIDNIKESMLEDIKALCQLLNCQPILIGIKNRYNALDENTIYLREGLPFISSETIHTILNNDSYPYSLSRKGGRVVFLDGNLMKNLREQKSITRKEMAEKLEVTKRTVSAYENEKMHPSEAIGKRILELLDDNSLFKKINIFEWSLKFSIDQKDLFDNVELNPFESQLKGIIDDIGLSSYWYNKGQVPFKLSLYSSIDSPENKEKMNIYPLFSEISSEKDKLNKLNLKSFMEFTNLFRKQGFLIVDNNFRIPDLVKNKIPIIKIKRLEKLDSEEEFIDLIQDSEN